MCDSLELPLDYTEDYSTTNHVIIVVVPPFSFKCGNFWLQLSLVSATSYESRCGPQVFAATGQYRGVVVRIKELKFSRKKDISREIMKEMRLLRDLRHDNINSFIGACVEPFRVLLVSDYCAKGSLYVSIIHYYFFTRWYYVLSQTSTLQIHTTPYGGFGKFTGSSQDGVCAPMLQVGTCRNRFQSLQHGEQYIQLQHFNHQIITHPSTHIPYPGSTRCWRLSSDGSIMNPESVGPKYH